MARKKGFNRLSGSIGDLTYVNHPLYGDLVRKKTGPSKERIANDPAYAPQRKSNNVFGNTSSASKLIRDGFKPSVDYTGDKELCARQMHIGPQLYREGMQFEADHPFHTEIILQLKGFRLNQHAGVHNVYGGTTNVDVNGLDLHVTISGGHVYAVGSYTHYRLICSLASFDFATKDYGRLDEYSGMLPAESVEGFACDFTLSTQFPVHMLMLTVLFYIETNGKYYRFNDRSFTAADIMEVFLIER